MLRGLTADRQRIKDCMGFCVGNAAASVEICETITEALTLPETVRAHMHKAHMHAPCTKQSLASGRRPLSLTSHLLCGLTTFYSVGLVR